MKTQEIQCKGIEAVNEKINAQTDKPIATKVNF